MQFEYTKRSVLIEKDELVLWRRKYISDIRRYRQEGRTIYYLDETWINSNDCSSKLCADTSVKFQKDEFPRDIPTRSSNPRKKDDAVIVMDNAPYHSVKKEQAPTIYCEKDAILEWLKSKGVVITEPYMLKFELLQKVQQIKHQYENYVVDEEAKKFNKIVLRLPPYHYELNPIKLALSIVKTHIKENNTTFSLDDIQKLLNDGIQRVTREMWSDFIINTLKEEDKFWQVDFVSDEMLEKLNMTSLVSLTAAEETTSDLENSE
ncbi:uncharacterized protein LOC112596748 [Melanaphis sacchari]|uniref:uncharacterized protein LOC112596748 n=1 Tax=Melanaphis sacchari TaxID=742174 RepID=UPI000DC13845|nr:uncharacterized protein LOC112596748 [Melanaphis sacchari]